MNDENTAYPGERVGSPLSIEMIEKFRSKYRGTDKHWADNVPTACTLNGALNHSVFTLKSFCKKKEVYFLVEYWPRELRVTTPQKIIEFHNSQKNWEDHDYCIFDATLSWCVGVTHNEDIIVVNEDCI